MVRWTGIELAGYNFYYGLRGSNKFDASFRPGAKLPYFKLPLNDGMII